VVELQHLVLRRIDAADPMGRASALIAELSALPLRERVARFHALVDEANSEPGGGALDTSGEIGWVAQDGVIADLRDAAFGSRRANGDIVGPIDTAAGPEIFLVEARFAESLDERGAAIAVEARTAGADLAVIAQRVAPADAARASGGPWRALAKLQASAIRMAGLDTAAVGDLTGPLDLDGQVVLCRLLEKRTAPYTPDELASLQLDGFGTWLGDRLAAATITLDPDPLGLGSPIPSVSAPPSGSQVPVPSFVTAGTPKAPAFGLPTPAIPVIPTLP